MAGCDRDDDWAARLRGELEASEAAGLDAHAAACSRCAAERDAVQALLARVAALPAFVPSRDLRPLPASRPAARGAGAWLRFAAAAAVLGAVASFLFVGTAGRAPALPVVVGRAEPLRWGETFEASRYSTVAVPGVGTLRVDRGSRLRFEGPRLAILEAGEVFAEIEPSGRGFELRASGASARVRGTRFGVRAPETVYVVEGSVDVSAGSARLRLGANQASVGPRLAELSAEDHLLWIARNERPALRLTLDPGAHAVVTPGAPLRWILRIESDALAPVLLGRPRDLSQQVSLLINGALAPLDAAALRLAEAAPASNGLVRCDAAHPVVLECAVDPALFREKGPVSVRAVLSSGLRDADPVWVGTVRSAPVTVEVR